MSRIVYRFCGNSRVPWLLLSAVSEVVVAAAAVGAACRSTTLSESTSPQQQQQASDECAALRSPNSPALPRRLHRQRFHRCVHLSASLSLSLSISLLVPFLPLSLHYLPLPPSLSHSLVCTSLYHTPCCELKNGNWMSPPPHKHDKRQQAETVGRQTYHSLSLTPPLPLSVSTYLLISLSTSLSLTPPPLSLFYLVLQ